MSVRSASRGSPAAKSIRFALRTSSIVATRSASFVRCVLRWFGSRSWSSALMLSAISSMPVMMCFQDPPRVESLNHTSIPHVNNLRSKLIDGKPALLDLEPDPRSLTVVSVSSGPEMLQMGNGPCHTLPSLPAFRTVLPKPLRDFTIQPLYKVDEALLKLRQLYSVHIRTRKFRNLAKTKRYVVPAPRAN